jgi:hypothetical protein
MKYIIYLLVSIFSLSIQAKEIEVDAEANSQDWQKRTFLIGTEKNTTINLKELQQTNANINHREIVRLIKQNKNLLTNSNTITSKNLLSETGKRPQITQQKRNFQGTNNRLNSNLKNLDLKTMFFAIEGMSMRQIEM